MYSIREYLLQRQVSLRSTPMISAAWFTHVRARTMLPPAPEWHEWQVLDSEDLRGDAPAAILRALAEGTAHLDDKVRYFGSREVGPDNRSAERLAAVLRPRFEMHAVAGDLRRGRASELINFIEEQYQALDAMADNRAVLFVGPAGCGKTLLAMEAVRREIALGCSGRLLCFNTLLSWRLREDLKGMPGLSVGTFHQELLRLAGVRPPPNAGTDFWDRELPDRALEALLDGQVERTSDFLVVDEVQDIARDPFLDVLDLLVDGGLHGGRLLLFGDFERQALFHSADGPWPAQATMPVPRLQPSNHELPQLATHRAHSQHPEQAPTWL